VPQHHYRLIQEGVVHVVELTLPMQVDAAEFDKINEEVVHEADAAPGDRWVLDLRSVDYVGSALLGLLVNLRQRIKTGGGTLVLCGLSNHVAKALRTCSLHGLFLIAPHRDEALKLASSAR
jgi:anti-anti-sigma factor